MKEPSLTVIMTVYNSAEYIRRALDSLLKQTNKNFKLLIINDGSQDATVKIAEEYRSKFSYFKLVSEENSGISTARNLGLKLVDTPYFVFHDGDDWTDPGYTDYFIQAFKQHPDVDLVCCGYFIDSIRIHSRPISKPMKGVLDKWHAYLKITGTATSPVKGYTWNKAYKTQKVRQNNLRFMDGLNFMEDQIFNIDYVAETGNVYFDAVPLYHYWQRKDSAVHSFSFKMIVDMIKINYLVWTKIFKSIFHEKNKKRISYKKNEKYFLDKVYMNKGAVKDDHQS